MADNEPEGQKATYFYSATINTPRGPMTWDGFLRLHGPIITEQDYMNARGLIAADGGYQTTPEKIQVNCLSILGMAD